MRKKLKAATAVRVRLYQSGVVKQVSRQMRQAGKLDLDKPVFVVHAGEVLGASTEKAAVSAGEWLGSAPSTIHRRPK